jgi:capsular polysaccharide biosynthesis protein
MDTVRGEATLGGSVEGGGERRGRGSRLSVAVGIAGFLVVMLIGAAVLATESTAYKATSTLVILPGSSVPASDYSSYLDTLSHGQIAQTASEILQLKQYGAQASRELHLSPTQAAASKVQVTVQSGTSLLTVTSTAPTGPIAERFADTVVQAATPTVNAVSSPYMLSVVSAAAHSAQSNGGLSLGKFLAVLVVVGLALAVGAQQATNQLQQIFGRRRAPAPARGRQAMRPGSRGRTAPLTATTAARANGDARRGPATGDRRSSAVPAPGGRRTKRAVGSSYGMVSPGGLGGPERRRRN